MSPAASLAGAVFLLTPGAFVGLYLTSAPIATVNWDAESGQRWVVPLGGGVGKIFHFGRLLVNAQLSAYYNVVRPDVGANWQIRAQMQLMFPKEFFVRWRTDARIRAPYDPRQVIGERPGTPRIR